MVAITATIEGVAKMSDRLVMPSGFLAITAQAIRQPSTNQIAEAASAM